MTRLLRLAVLPLALSAQAEDHLVFAGGDGPGKGKHVVLLAGDEEYRSEEAMPQMAKILAKHGFTCTVLFSLAADGTIDPTAGASLSNPAALDRADAIMMSLRFRNWSDEAFKHFEGAFHRGVPIIALRTSTHAFNLKNKESPYYKYTWNNKDPAWQGGFGKQVLGETWVSHWGKHKGEATRGVIEPANRDHPLLRGVADVFGDTDVYEVRLPQDAVVLLRGQVVAGMKPTDPPVEGKKNAPMMPVAWTREYKNAAGTVNKVFCTTLGSSSDLASEDLRRLLVNSVYWGLGLDIPAKADAAVVGDFKPTFYGFGTWKKGVHPADLK
jgi:hypothetical protein